MMSEPPRIRLVETTFFERHIRLRLPFRFGVVTMTEAPQAFVRARIRTRDGREGFGMSAELLAPKWFDKSPALPNEDNFDQLRRALAIAAQAYAEVDGWHSAFGLHVEAAGVCRDRGRAAGLPPLAAGFGPALLDRAILDALLRLERIDVFAAARENLFGLDHAMTPDLAGFDLDSFLRGLRHAPTIAVRQTVGLVDALTDAEAAPEPADGLPRSLEGLIRTYGLRFFKLKACGDQAADIDRLCAIADVLDALPDYRITLDGNEQFDSAEAVLGLMHLIDATPALTRLRQGMLFLEQPIARAVAIERDIGLLAKLVPVAIDESDDDIETFPRARQLGYAGVSSKSCKGFYRSLLNRARCAAWNAESGGARYFMSAEDLTVQAGLGMQQDLALASLIGCAHIERNAHHYVDGMAAAPEDEQAAFLAAHPDTYERRLGAVRLAIREGAIGIGSLEVPGLGSGALPDCRAVAWKKSAAAAAT
jgi:hypothetical protein